MYKKEDIIDEAYSMLQLISKKSKTNMTRTVAWYRILNETINKFIADVNQTVLFDKLEDSWIYHIEYNYFAFELQLLHQDVYFDDDDQPQSSIDQVFTLVKTPAPYLSTAEYAKIYGVGETAIRNMLRRGKLRAAKRVGNLWQIPALLTPPKKRGYQSASYYWDAKLIDVPKEFSYLDKYEQVTIEQDKKDKTKYIVSLYRQTASNATKEVILDALERERFELYLISNPDIHYIAPAHEGVLADIIFDYDEEDD